MGLCKIKHWEVQSNAYMETSALHTCFHPPSAKTKKTSHKSLLKYQQQSKNKAENKVRYIIIIIKYINIYI